MSTLGTINSATEVKDTATQTPTPSATINLTIVAGKNTVCSWTAGENETVNITSGVPSLGDELTMIITNDGVLPRIITFGTLITSVGIVTGVVNTKSIIKFIGNGTSFFEVSRTIAI